MRYRYDIIGGTKKLKTKLTVAVATFGLLLGGSGLALVVQGSASAASTNVVYNNIPKPQPGNVPSVGFEATSTSEFGGQVGLDGTARKNPEITVLMSSWACKSGTWNNKNCISNLGSKFNHPITLNVYNVNPDDSAGSVIVSQTQTFDMPYRPTMDDGTNCNDGNGNPDGRWWDGSSCNNGKAFEISFKLNGVTLPDNVIIGVAYNTSHYGNAPIGTTACNATPQGCPYDSLNVGTAPEPTVGEALPSVDDAYLNSTWTGAYCDNGTNGTGSFRLDAGCWTGYLPAFRVETKGKNNKGHGSHHKHNNHRRGDKNHHKKYSGWHGFYQLNSH